jgi:hypothetical protein
MVSTPKTYVMHQGDDIDIANADVTGALAVTGAATFASTVAVTGALSPSSLAVTNGATVGTTLVVTGLTTVTGGLKETVTVASADGAIAVKSGIVMITKAGVAAMTIADPTATTDDGKTLTFVSTTAQAHTLDNSAGSGFNGGGAGSDVGTWGGAIGDGITITAYNGVWYVVPGSNLNVTLA